MLPPFARRRDGRAGERAGTVLHGKTLDQNFAKLTLYGQQVRQNDLGQVGDRMARNVCRNVYRRNHGTFMIENRNSDGYRPQFDLLINDTIAILPYLTNHLDQAIDVGNGMGSDRPNCGAFEA